MKTKIYFLLAVAVVLLSACSENPYVSKSVVDSLIENQKVKLYNISVISNNDVYWLPRQDSVPHQLTHTPNQIKKDVRINHNHTKIAYLDQNGSPVIIDLNGKILEKLSQYQNIKSMDWSNDDQTLYMLIGNKLYFYGKAMSVPEFTFKTEKCDVYDNLMDDPGRDFEVLSVSISAKKDIAYIFSYYDLLNKPVYKITIKNSTGTIIKDSCYSNLRATNVRYFGSNNEHVLYYSLSSTLEKISVYSDYELSVFSLETNPVAACYNPAAGYVLYVDDRSGKYNLTAVKIDGAMSMVSISPFVNCSSMIYIDWK